MSAQLFRTLVILLLIPFQLLGDELQDRSQVLNTAPGLFEGEEFAEIVSTSRRYRETEERFESGIWKLAEFYKGFADHARSPYLRVSALDRLDEQTNQLLEQYPNSAGVVIFRAELLNAVAWRIRGGGFIQDVQPEDLKRFYELINQTIEHLELYRAVGNVDPQWYNLLSAAYWAMDDSENATTIMLEGIERFPSYYGLYFMTGLYLSPIWYGDAELLEGFANFAVENTQDSEGTGLYARIYWSATANQYSQGNLFIDSMVDWKKMKISMFDVLERYPGDWNAQNFAYLACLKGDADMAKEMLLLVEDEPFAVVWGRDISFDSCKLLAGV